jgi:hypothetical protein
MNKAALEYIAVGLGALLLANGLYMLITPQHWYQAIPGVVDTGNFNVHFIRDIGIIYSLSAIGLIWGARRADQRLGMWGMAALWLTGHALFHVWEVVTGVSPAFALARDFLGVSLPALLTLYLLYAGTRQPDA